MKQPFIPSVTPPDPLSAPALWFAYANQKLLIYENNPEPIPSLTNFSELGLSTVRQQYLGQFNGTPCFSVELVDETVPPPGMALRSLRELLEPWDDHLISLAGRAIQIVDWDRTHQYCGRCAAKMLDAPEERAKHCPVCGLSNYPRISPCIIVRVNRGQELLLARNPRWPPGRYSNVAGFVEPGETLEEAVQREVMEEVGIQIKNIRYFGSQPWPFPNSLMMGFTAEYAAGKIQVDAVEIEDAGWFSLNNLPLIPSKVSISGQLLEAFISAQQSGPKKTP